MDNVGQDRVVIRVRGWRRVLQLVSLWFGAVFVADLLPLSGWSDVRSKWLNAAVLVGVCAVFMLLAAHNYWKIKTISGLQALLLYLLFGCTLMLAAQELYADMLFLQELKNHRAVVNKEEPNPALMATPVCVLFSFLGPWSGAPDLGR